MRDGFPRVVRLSVVHGVPVMTGRRDTATARVLVAALLVPLVWIVLAAMVLGIALTMLPMRSARAWLPALAVAGLAVAAWLAWVLARRFILAGRRAPARGRAVLRVVK